MSALLRGFSNVDLAGERLVAIDMEATSNDPFVAKPLLFQVATRDKSYVVDIREKDLEPVREVLESRDVVKVVQNAAWEYVMLKHHYGIELTNVYDTMIAELVLKAGITRECSLEHLALQYLGRGLNKQVRRLFMVSPTITEEMIDYAREDVEVLIPIFLKQRESIKKKGLMGTCTLEFSCVPAVGQMKLAGLKLDLVALEEVLSDLGERDLAVRAVLTEHLSPGYQLTVFGTSESLINFNSRIQIMEAFSKIGIHLTDVQKDTIRRFRAQYPENEALMAYQIYKKVATFKGFGLSFPKFIHPVTGRIHPDYFQVGTVAGRFKCKKPNLQQVPIRRVGWFDFDPEIFRQCFVAEEGYKTITSDYGQIELRIIAEFSHEPIMLDAFQRGEDLHRVTAALIFDVPLDEVTEDQREVAKTINFGLMYGISPDGLAAELGVSQSRASNLHRKYYTRYAGINSWMARSVNASISRGYCMTVLGRKRWLFPEGKEMPPPDRRGALTRICRNTPTQGTSADILKEGMVRVKEAIAGYDARIVHVVHDEILVECREDQAEEVAVRINRAMVKGGERFLKRVPTVVDTVIGPSWSKKGK